MVRESGRNVNVGRATVAADSSPLPGWSGCWPSPPISPRTE